MNKDTPELAFMRLIEAALDEALAHEDATRFLDWCRAHVASHLEKGGAELPPEPEARALFGLHMGRAIWNALPLPGHGLRPRPLPEPGRNEPCFCGSGRKYKHCCAQLDLPLDMDREEMLAVVLSRLSPEALERLRASGQLPAAGIVSLAEQECNDQRPRKAAALLEPLFEGRIRKTDDLHEHALNLLCSCYEDLGWRRKKSELLQRVVETVPASPLRSGAWQRLATIHLDAGDHAAAWRAFRQAQQDDPDSPHIGLLEVQLHISTGELDKARNRAAFWLKRLQKQGWEPEEKIMQLFSRVAADPAGAMAELGFQMMEGVGADLRNWLRGVAERPLPGGYRLASSDASEPQEEAAAEESDDLEGLRQRLRGMGVPREEIERALRDLKQQLAERSTADEAGGEEPPGWQIVTPQPLQRLYQDWQLVFPLGKPFSVSNDSFERDADAWDPEQEARWTAFLQNHPEAFDSLDILDDLATALFEHPQIGGGWLEEVLLLPVLRRAEAILERLLQEEPRAVLPWTWLENRPALRSLARLVLVHLRAGQQEAALAAVERLLQLNPGDNHGFRCWLANYYLQQGEDEKLLELADRFPDDMNPELAYGRVLALYRLGRRDEALQALEEAMECLPRVVRHLTAKRVRKPAINPHGVQIGGDDQAWLYRDAVHDTWLATPGALDWLKKTARKLRAAE